MENKCKYCGANLTGTYTDRDTCGTCAKKRPKVKELVKLCAEIKSYAASVERCVCCGAVIPEGTQYCLNCEIKAKGTVTQ